jgi:hypothetical protein
MARKGSKGRSAPRAANAVPQNGLLLTQIAQILHAHNTIINACAVRLRSHVYGGWACGPIS